MMKIRFGVTFLFRFSLSCCISHLYHTWIEFQKHSGVIHHSSFHGQSALLLSVWKNILRKKSDTVMATIVAVQYLKSYKIIWMNCLWSLGKNLLSCAGVQGSARVCGLCGDFFTHFLPLKGCHYYRVSLHSSFLPLHFIIACNCGLNQTNILPSSLALKP